MGEPASTAPLRRQVRLVRRRSNLHLAQQVLATWVAVASLVAAALVVAALRAGPAAFTAVTAAGALVIAAASVLTARRVRRRWLRAAASAAHVDAARGLRGRLRSVLELDGRAGGPFFDLLLEQNHASRARWRPEELVPEAVPVRTVGLAIGALSLLAFAIVSAPRLRPAPPRVVVGERRIDYVRTAESPAGADRVLVAPGAEQPAPAGPAGAEGDAEPGALADASAAFQAWLQDALGVDDAGMADAAGGPPGEPASATRRGDGRGPGAPAQPAEGDGETGGTAADDEDAAARLAAAADEAARVPGAGPGAGDGADPALYGADTGDGAGARDRFELAIAARIRTRRGDGTAPWTAAPGAAGDRRPHLAGQQRVEQPAHRMPVPDTLAPIVRRLFAHGAEVR